MHCFYTCENNFFFGIVPRPLHKNADIVPVTFRVAYITRFGFKVRANDLKVCEKTNTNTCLSVSLTAKLKIEVRKLNRNTDKEYARHYPDSKK